MTTITKYQQEMITYHTKKMGVPEIKDEGDGIRAVFTTKSGTIELFLDEKGTISRYGFPLSIGDIKIPEHAEKWEGDGYMGGHTSQSHWDYEQVERKAYDLLIDGYTVVDSTESGSISGYYPELIYWK